MNRANTRPQRSDKRQVSRYHLFRLVPRAIQLLRGLHALGDHRFEAGKRKIFDVFFPLRPAEMLSTKRIHVSKLSEPADHSVERADGR